MADKINAESMQAAYNENYQMFLAKNADYGIVGIKPFDGAFYFEKTGNGG
ncbi:hypothetical protein ACFKI6_00630 [Streptococcus agalactiae]